jgi:bifunctional UDP-N-acetylglucosamine pyrophosphorylase/glucosamine-1-phosphate N-acetyltransferase
VVLGHQSNLIKATLAENIFTVDQPKMLGTADAVKCTEAHLMDYQGDILILCGDTPLLNKTTVKRIIQKHKKTKSVCTFLTAVIHSPKGYGRVIRDKNGDAVAIREDKDAVGLERDIAEINVGVYCCQSGGLFKSLKEIKINEKKKEFYLTDIVEFFSKNGLRVETVKTEDPLEGLGVNTREDLAAAETVLRQRVLSRLMLDGVTIVDPTTTYIDEDTKIGYDTRIYPFTFIEGDVRIGRNCKIGPYARLRRGTRIDDYVEIGNFTEVSRTKIGSKTYMKHFSYLGDALLGANVNIGAGTITANFDGRQKNVTKISDGAFIGSDAVLIAPVKVGRKAVVGAGSVVTKGTTIPDGGLAVGVPARIIVKEERK